MVNLSIIVPHYNSSATLNKLIETIPYSKEIQVIIIDDHSDKDHKEELNKLRVKYAFRNIEIYNNESEKNSAGACRNIGLNHATGEWILFADADDYFLNGFFDIVKQYFNSTKDVVFFKPTSIEFDTGKITDRHLPYVKMIDNYQDNKSLASEVALRYSFVVPWSKLIKSSLIKRYNIVFDEVIASNDVMFSTRVGYYMKNFGVSNSAIYCVTRSKGSLSTTLSHEVFDSRLKVFLDYHWFLKENLTDREFKSLGLGGRDLLIKSINFGVRKVFTVYLKLRRNSIPVVEIKNLNPIRFIRRLILMYRKHKNLKKYYMRKK